MVRHSARVCEVCGTAWRADRDWCDGPDRGAWHPVTQPTRLVVLVDQDPLLKALIQLGRELHLHEVLRGGAAPPQPGDLVVETTAFPLDADGIGFLIAPATGDDDAWWVLPLSDEQPPDPGYQRWRNASFARLPDRVADLLRATITEVER